MKAKGKLEMFDFLIVLLINDIVVMYLSFLHSLSMVLCLQHVVYLDEELMSSLAMCEPR